MKPINIVVQYAGNIFELPTADSAVTIGEITITMKKRPGNKYQPIATVNNEPGDASRFYMQRPEIIKVEWVD